MSTDKVIDSSDVFLKSTNAYYPSTYNSYFYANLVIPATTPVGNYYILFIVDYGNLISESNEINNVSYYSITVIEPSVDLNISTAYIANPTLTSGLNLE